MSEITLEQATEAVQLKKDAVKTAKAELRAFRKENKLKPDDVPGEVKIIKSLDKLTKKLDEAQAELEAAQEVEKSMRPAKGRAAKYEFPADCVTAADKKKYRAKKRREAKAELKAAEKAANPDASEEKKSKKKSKDAEVDAEAPEADAPEVEAKVKSKKRRDKDED